MKKSLFLALFLSVSNILSYEIIVDETIVAGFQRDDTKEVVVDYKKHLMWQDDKSVKTTRKDWSGAIEYCKNLNFAGFSDWRLPSIDELLSITDDTKYNPAIKDGFVNVTADDYWSSSPSVSDSSYAWRVVFDDGGDGWYDKSNSALVRCVRDSN